MLLTAMVSDNLDRTVSALSFRSSLRLRSTYSLSACARKYADKTMVLFQCINFTSVKTQLLCCQNIRHKCAKFSFPREQKQTFAVSQFLTVLFHKLCLINTRHVNWKNTRDMTLFFWVTKYLLSKTLLRKFDRLPVCFAQSTCAGPCWREGRGCAQLDPGLHAAGPSPGNPTATPPGENKTHNKTSS